MFVSGGLTKFRKQPQISQKLDSILRKIIQILWNKISRIQVQDRTKNAWSWLLKSANASSNLIFDVTYVEQEKWITDYVVTLSYIGNIRITVGVNG